MPNVRRGTSRRIRNAALAGSAAVLLCVAAPVAAWAAPPGNNGDIKIHNVGTGVDDNRDEPKVGCFYIDAFNFDPNQQLNWSVFQGTPGNTGSEVASGSAVFTAGKNGQDISGPISLPLGKYVAFEDDSAGRKTKEFEVTSTCNSGVPLVNPKVAGAAGAVAVPAVLGYVFWRRRNATV